MHLLISNLSHHWSDIDLLPGVCWCAKLLSEQIVTFCQLDPTENEFENAVCKMEAI